MSEKENPHSPNLEKLKNKNKSEVMFWLNIHIYDLVYQAFIYKVCPEIHKCKVVNSNDNLPPNGSNMFILLSVCTSVVGVHFLKIASAVSAIAATQRLY